jgi:hypothetical protein
MAGLPWVRLDTSFFDNPKILALCSEKDGYRAAFVYVSSIAYSGKHGTDGRIETYVLTRLNARRTEADRLVRHGLWKPTETGWVIHDYEVLQQTSETTDQIKADRRRAAVKGNCVRHHGPDCGCWTNGLSAVP